MLVRLVFFSLYCLTAALAMFGSSFLAKKRGWKLPQFVVVILASVLMGILSYNMVQGLPRVTEEIKITALNMEGMKHRGVEVEVVGAKVDDYDYVFDKLTSGKWIAVAQGFKWYSEADITNGFSQTDSIVLDIPVGRKRNILFDKHKKGGVARIELGDSSYLIDTSQKKRIELLPSDNGDILLQDACRLFAYVLVFAVLAVLLLYLYNYYVVRGMRSTRLIYILLSICSLALLVRYSKGHSFWLDEMYQVGFSGGSNTLYQTLMVAETSPPLFRLLANLWYDIVPYGEEWLLLPGEIFCACTVYVGGMLCEKAMGRRAGVIGAIFLCFSSTIAINAAYEFRPYSLLLLLSFVLTYVFMDMVRRVSFECRKLAVYTLLMILISYTHYFGLLLCGIYFLIAVYLVCSKLLSARYLISYPVLFVGYIPWIIRFLQMGQIGLSAMWMDTPTLYSTFAIVLQLCNQNVFCMILICLGIFALAAGLLKDRVSHDQNPVVGTPETGVSLVTCILTISIVYCYGTMVNPTAPLWVDRYFIILLPHVTLLLVFGVLACISLMKSCLPSKLMCSRNVFSVAVCCMMVLQSFPLIAESQITKYHYSDGFEPAAQYLCEQDKVLTKAETIVVSDYKASATKGWVEYYLCKQGVRDQINVVSYAELIGEDEPEQFNMKAFSKKYKHLYRFCRGEIPNKAFDKLLKDYYKLKNVDEELDILEYKRIEQ